MAPRPEAPSRRDDANVARRTTSTAASEEGGEAEPAFDPAHIGHDGFDLIREVVRQSEHQGDAKQGSARVGHHELPERDARAPRGQERGGAESHDVPRGDDGLQGVPSKRCVQPLLPRRRQDQPDQPPVEDPLTPVPADPVQRHIAGEHPQQADGQRQPPPDEARVAQQGGGDDRHFLWDWHAQAPEQEHGENAEVREVVDELLKCLHGVLRSIGYDKRGPGSRILV